MWTAVVLILLVFNQKESISTAPAVHQYIDISIHCLTIIIVFWQIHAWDDGTPIEETLSALNDIVRQGKVRYVGASNVLGWQMQKIVEVCKAKGYDRWVALQVNTSDDECYDVQQLSNVLFSFLIW